MKKDSDQITAYLGKETEFDAKMSFKGTVCIGGRFRGQIFAEGTLIVAESAVVEADIQVSQITVSGEVRGNLLVKERLEIQAPGKVFGNIKAPILVMDEGSVFEGNCQMKKLSGQNEDKVAFFPQSSKTKTEI
ncbi:MAG: polymer-forming cytoskeletal protein [Pseudomonadota bacterium]